MGLLALLPTAVLISKGLPADTKDYIEEKYSGWNGVLRAWVCNRWSTSGSFVRWLNSCAAEFEKSHEGVYLEFTPVSEATINSIWESGIRPPELLFFSPGILRDTQGLLPMDSPNELRLDLSSCGSGYALPVAMGGYLWVYNSDLCTGIPNAGQGSLTALPDEEGYNYSAAMTALLSDAFVQEGNGEEIDEPERELDLGLPTAAEIGESGGIIQTEDALDQFIRGEIPFLCVSQRELDRLTELKEAGRGPEWMCIGGGISAYTDQLLMVSLVKQGDMDGAQREALATEFATSLCSQENQRKLSEIGAFSVTGELIYDGFSSYAPLDTHLNSIDLLVPASFSDPSTCPGKELLQARWAGSLNSTDALIRLAESCG